MRKYTLQNNQNISNKAKQLKGSITNEEAKRLGIKIAQELSDLIVYCISVPFKSHTEKIITGFASEESSNAENVRNAGGRCETMSSLNEDRAKIMVREHRPAFQLYHQKQLTRIYPKVINIYTNLFAIS